MPTPSILFLPIIEWRFRTQRPQQLARCFARGGARVYYADLRLAAAPPPPRPIEQGIWRVALAGDPGLDPYRAALSPADVERALDGLAAVWPERRGEGRWVVAQLPSWRPLAEAVRERFGARLLFDCLDDFASFGDHGDLAGEEAALAGTADLVTATSQALFDKLAPLARRILLVRNGCDPEHFVPRAWQPRAGDPAVVGYFGGIHDWFDVALVEEVARRRPDWRLWLIGDTYRCDVEALRALPSVTFFGEVPYVQLPRVVSCFQIGIIPFKVSPLTLATNPVKVYEMLAAGLPVVSVDLPELRLLAPLVALARTAGEFVARIAEALADDSPAARARRREFAREQSWVERFLALRAAMAELDGGRAPAAPAAELLGELKGEREMLSDGAALLAAARSEHDAWSAQAAALDRERESLVEQRDRVQAEAERLRRELERVEGERLGLERRVHEITASRLWRTGERLRRLRKTTP
jgi:glycosyltransferase involved in cell wall biosynthesis